MNELARKKCQPCEGGIAPLAEEQVAPLLKGLPGWSREGKAITKAFRFKNYFETMAFVNAVAWVAPREDHHPDLRVGYAECQVTWWTHAVGGLSENDFICAAKVDALFEI
jgi:4a-hydroxytetrahydrobiopterin dehydratase